MGVGVGEWAAQTTRGEDLILFRYCLCDRATMEMSATDVFNKLQPWQEKPKIFFNRRFHLTNSVGKRSRRAAISLTLSDSNNNNNKSNSKNVHKKVWLLLAPNGKVH